MEPAASERPLVSFQRAYSCIEGLQPAYTVRYELFLEREGTDWKCIKQAFVTAKPAARLQG